MLFSVPFLSRSLGVHCSKVRSLTLDSWEPELLKVCERALEDEAHWSPEEARVGLRFLNLDSHPHTLYPTADV